MFRRCHVLRNGKLCNYEGTMFFSKNRRPVCLTHRKAIVAGDKVSWASKRLLAWDAQNQMANQVAAIELALANEQYYSKENYNGV